MTASTPEIAAEHADERGVQPRSRNVLAIVSLTILVGVIYLSTMLAGVEHGDAAQIQYMSDLLGVCHPPGYATEVVAGWLFSRIPIGPDVAWRVNLLMVICGVGGCLALYGAVRRITGQIMPGVIAATLLAFSSMYWHYALFAEAYVFYGLFLLLAVYALVRFIESDKATWLYLTALAFGICVAGRPSELFVAPGFLAAWIVYRRRAPLDAGRLTIAAVLLLAPMALSIGYVFVRDNPSQIYKRDDALRQSIFEPEARLEDRSTATRLADAAYYALGLKWAAQAGVSAKNLRHDARRYARMLSGADVALQPPRPTYGRKRDEGFGAGIGAIGLALAVLGVVWRRDDWGWPLLGAGLFLGNLAFYLWHHRWDGLTFTVPGLAGLALLAGLGAAGPLHAKRPVAWRRVCIAAGLIMSLALLATNYRLVDRAGEDERVRRRIESDFKALPWPRDCALLCNYWEATQYRYLLHLQAGRTDVRMIEVAPSDAPRAARALSEKGAAIFLSPRYRSKIDQELRKAAEAQTPPKFRKQQILLLHPGSRVRR